jgi:ribosome-binding factor A
MPSDPKRREELLAHCGELRDDDGVDPREYFKPAVSHGRQRKIRQLCS